MLYSARTLAVLVGFAAPVAGFAARPGTGTMIPVETENVAPDWNRPNLQCCPGSSTYPACEAFQGEAGHSECLPVDICEKIDNPDVPADQRPTILTGDDWCGSQSKLGPTGCAGGMILRQGKKMVTTKGSAVEYLVCSWDYTNEYCRLAEWSYACLDKSVEYGCGGVSDTITPKTGQEDMHVATKCRSIMQKSSLQFDANGNPKWISAKSCEQILMDCAGAGIAEDSANCPTGQDACCNPLPWGRRELQREIKVTPAPKAHKARRLATDCPKMYDSTGALSGYCCTKANEPIYIASIENTNFQPATESPAVRQAQETCALKKGDHAAGEDDVCACSVNNGDGTGVDVGQVGFCPAGPPFAWGMSGSYSWTSA